MTDVWSGGIIYMYFEEANNYGLVEVDGDEVKTLEDFENLKTQIVSVSPKIAKTGDVSADATLACPATYANWAAATELPPTPDQAVCDCIKSSSKCVVADSVKEKDYGELFGTICGQIDCSDINADGESGEYGAYSFCSAEEKLNYVLNKYYEDANENSSACDFDGAATVVDASAASTCSDVLAGKATASGSSKGSKSGSSNKSGSGSGSSSGSGSASTASGSSSSTGGAAAGAYSNGFSWLSILSTLLFSAVALIA
ncbi:unnamed protein product [Ambrosiozyma monospora]|uniref:Unnamed protein product n=1 Tax=Ambrosiozyma monospora TaxID=43982 RepID=A0ACB5U7G5_AMBMO|nr:unnamed protein product [Ambrosiozyma monospora]